MLAQGLLEAALKLAGSDSDDSDEEEERVFKQSRSQTLHKIIVE